jgi:hypothetical protein
MIMQQLTRPESRCGQKKSSKLRRASEKRERGKSWRKRRMPDERLEGNLWQIGEFHLHLKPPYIPGMWWSNTRIQRRLQMLRIRLVELRLRRAAQRHHRTPSTMGPRVLIYPSLVLARLMETKRIP